MSTERLKYFTHYINPLTWMRSLCVDIVTCGYLFVYYFGSFLVIVLIALMSFFVLDRYNACVDGHNGNYVSPFSQLSAMQAKKHETLSPIRQKSFMDVSSSEDQVPARRYYSIQDEVNRRLRQMKQSARANKSRY